MSTMIKLLSQELCKGCGLCQNICPNDCISMEYDEEGFLIPIKDETNCSGCNICMRKCIAINTLAFPSSNIELYCAKSEDKNNLSFSTSGGIFGELAKSVIENHNGVVYGAVYENAFSVKHVRAITVEDTIPMHYSKYVQSNTTGIYRQVRADLLAKRTVLFTGTPCQIVALKTFLGKEYDELICMDVLCYGVMSTYVLRDYIKYVLHSTDELTNINVCFRSKRIPNSRASFILTKGDDLLFHEPFYDAKKGIGRGFGGGFVNRESCNKCEYQQIGRYSDITLGDYVKQNTVNDLSSSLVLINSKKGQILFDNLVLKKELLADKDRDFSLARVNKKTQKNKYRDDFFDAYINCGINETTIEIWEKDTSNITRKLYSKCYKLFGFIKEKLMS